MRIEPDSWLSETLGFAAFKVLLPAETDVGNTPGISVEPLCASAHGQHAFYYAKVPTVRVDQVRALTTAGFTVVDVNVTLEREPPAEADRRIDDRVVVREIRPDEHDRVSDIAGSCFVYSRFHLDPQLTNELANRVKRAWVESYCHKRRGECLYVAELEGIVVGFNAVLATRIQGKTVRVIDLIGVDNAHQGHGVGRSLVAYFLRESAGRADSVRVGTQVANIPSMRLYEECGFSSVETTYVLHAHVREGQLKR